MKSFLSINKYIVLLVFMVLINNCLSATHNDFLPPTDSIKEKIWRLEFAYFSNLYKANYDSVLFLVDENFTGWPSSVEKPLNKAGSSIFMKKLIPLPTNCSFTIEREALIIVDNTALSHYIINVSCQEIDGSIKTSSSRITHTWIYKYNEWKLLGGMSFNK